jgi:hypothetical protein
MKRGEHAIFYKEVKGQKWFEGHKTKDAALCTKKLFRDQIINKSKVFSGGGV